MKKLKTRAKTPCKCLRCGVPTQEKIDGKTWLICGDEACDMRCEVCTDRPNVACRFVESEVGREAVLV